MPTKFVRDERTTIFIGVTASPRKKAYVVCCMTGDEIEKSITTQAASEHANGLFIEAVVSALKSVPEGEEVVIVTNSAYLTDNHSLVEAWTRNGWRVANGETVKNDIFWRHFKDLKAKRKVTFVKSHAGIDTAVCAAQEALKCLAQKGFNSKDELKLEKALKAIPLKKAPGSNDMAA